MLDTEKLELLTGDVIVCHAFEFKSHVVWTELLELDGEFDVFLWFVAGHQHIGVQYGAAGLGLLFLHQVEFIKLIRSPHFPFGADNVQFVTDFWVDHQALPRHKPATQSRQSYNKSQTHLYSLLTLSRICISADFMIMRGKTWVQIALQTAKILHKMLQRDYRRSFFLLITHFKI